MTDFKDRPTASKPFKNAARAELVEGCMSTLRDAAMEREISNARKASLPTFGAGMGKDGEDSVKTVQKLGPDVMASLHAVLG